MKSKATYMARWVEVSLLHRNLIILDVFMIKSIIPSTVLDSGPDKYLGLLIKLIFLKLLEEFNISSSRLET